ncbi:hypothetical protein CLF_111425 [Clonorchis sinensis]|uniref:Helix-turn-helix domain-containing protein n=1 Tax=Clonorchis sinensis TaxID=79923 RepID=H2KV69_CLOSI|nr:hypothetical protein CLF_111425 [Clonorchis sinensis]
MASSDWPKVRNQQPITIQCRLNAGCQRRLDPRTVTKTPRRCRVRQKAGGMYIYLGLKAGLLRQLHEIHTRVTNIDIQMNVDGIRAYNNSGTQPFVIEVYCGKNKPNDAEQLISDTVTELTDVLVNGASGVYHIHTIRLLAYGVTYGEAMYTDQIPTYHSKHPNCHKQSCIRTLFKRTETHGGTMESKVSEEKRMYRGFHRNIPSKIHSMGTRKTRFDQLNTTRRQTNHTSIHQEYFGNGRTLATIVHDNSAPQTCEHPTENNIKL